GSDPGDPDSDPTTVDLDGDGMNDAWEAANGLDPLDPADADHDWDYDGLTNLQEYQAGTDPKPKWRTVPIVGMPGWGGGIGGDGTLASPAVGSFNPLGQLVRVERAGNQVVARRWDPLAVSGEADG